MSRLTVVAGVCALLAMLAACGSSSKVGVSACAKPRSPATPSAAPHLAVCVRPADEISIPATKWGCPHHRDSTTWSCDTMVEQTCKVIPSVRMKSGVDATVLTAGAPVRRVQLAYGALVFRKLTRVQGGWRFPALDGLRSAESHVIRKYRRETVAELRHAHGSRRAMLRTGLTALRRAVREMAKVDAGKLPVVVYLTVTGPHFLLQSYTFCVTSS